MGLPNTGAADAGLLPEVLWPNAAPPAAVLEPEAGDELPHGDTFAPRVDTPPKAGAVLAEEPNAGAAGLDIPGANAGARGCEGAATDADPSTTARPEYVVPCRMESV